MLQRVRDAVAEWERRSCVTFPERTTETNFITIYKGSGCSSRVGMSGGNQPMNLAFQSSSNPQCVNVSLCPITVNGVCKISYGCSVKFAQLQFDNLIERWWKYIHVESSFDSQEFALATSAGPSFLLYLLPMFIVVFTLTTVIQMHRRLSSCVWMCPLLIECSPLLTFPHHVLIGWRVFAWLPVQPNFSISL